MEKNRNGNRNKITRRQFLKYSGISMGMIGATGLIPHKNIFAATPKKGGHFKPACVGYNVFRSLDPAMCAVLGEYQIGSIMFNSLLRFDGNMNIVPDLAQSWSIPNDTTYRFKLYPGMKFHDGGECTAEDVVFTLDRVRNPSTGSPNQDKFNEIEQIKAMDKLTVEIKTKRPFAPLLSYLCSARTGSQIVSRKAVERLGAEYGKQPIGTGPFKIVDWKPNEKVEFVRNDQYFLKGLPYLKQITAYLISEESTAANAVMSGDVELVSTIPFSDVKALEAAKGVRVMKQPGLNIRFVQFNCQTKPFDDMVVRQAVAHAFDRKNLINAVIFGEGVEIQGPIPPAIKWAYNPQMKTQPFDPERAKSLLVKSKYKKEDLNFTILTWGTGWWKRWAEIVAAQASEVLGIQIRVEVLETGAVFTRYQEGNYQAGVFGWLGLVEPDEYAYGIFHSKGPKNFLRYSNPKTDEFLEKARTTMEKTERAKYYHQAEEIIGSDAPAAFCFSNLVHNAMRDYVKDFVPIPFSAFGAQFDRVWLDKG